jgi:hypothetical protein
MFAFAAVLMLVTPTWTPGACDLLAPHEIQTVQHVNVEGSKPSDQQQRSLRFAQCLFTAADFVHSVSLTVITADAAGGAAVQTYWANTFHRRPMSAHASRKKDPPRRIAEMGDEAFWTGDSRTGALYVLAGDSVLRISVGGVTDEAERIRRSRRLAQAALQRLPAFLRGVAPAGI